MVASRAPQWSQFGASLDTTAPQLWQFNVCAFMARCETPKSGFPGRLHFHSTFQRVPCTHFDQQPEARECAFEFRFTAP